MVRSKPENYGSLVAADDDLTTSMDNVMVPPDTEIGSLFVPLSNVDRNQQKKGMETDFSWLSRRFPVIIVVSVTTILFLAYAGSMTMSNRQKDNTIVTDITKQSYENEVEGTTIEKMTEITIPYTLTRKGYPQLPYFQAGASTVTTYAFLTNYQSIIEPYVDMLLTVYQSTQDAVKYSYNVCDTTGTNCYAGSYTVNSEEQTTINVPCKASNQYTLTVQAFDSSNNVISSTTSSAICMYVRREIRELTDDDLSATMDAMHTLWTTTDVEGISILITHSLLYHHTNTFSTVHSHILL